MKPETLFKRGSKQIDAGYANIDKAARMKALEILKKYRSIQEIVTAMGTATFWGTDIYDYNDGSIGIRRKHQIEKDDQRVSDFYDLFEEYETYLGPWRFDRRGLVMTDW